MSGQQKRGFRLPWAAERAPDEGAAGAATLDPASRLQSNGVDSDDLGDGPFRLAGASPTSTEDAVPAAPDVPEVTAEAPMIETQSTEPAALAGADAATDGSAPPTANAWPDVDRRSSPRHADDAELAVARPPIHAAGEPRVPRRENPLVAGLVKAMREAAVASRDETLTRLHAEAEARVESIRTRATAEAAELRKRAENDVTEIREWSKTEIARVRQVTDERIEARRSELAGETERHAASVERLVVDVQAVVEAFQSDMDGFFERLLAENDPARLAALAEQAPDAPDLTGDGPAAIDLADDSADAPAPEPARADLPMDEPVGEAAGEPVVESLDESADPPAVEALAADAAAEAEVAASEGLDLAAGTEWPAAILTAARRAGTAAETTEPAAEATEPAAEATEPAAEATEPADDGATRLLVTGLTSVAGISALKGALGQLPGVNAVSVSSGERGVFVFAVRHEPDIDLASGLTGLPGFGARITDATDAGIAVVAHEPAA